MKPQIITDKMRTCHHNYGRTGKTITMTTGHYDVMKCSKCGMIKKSYYRETVDDYMGDY